MRKILLLVLASFLVVPVFGDERRSTQALQEKPKEAKKVSDLMKKKLVHSQKVLEGIAINDFKLIAQNADELIAVSKEAEWKVLKTPQYELYSNEMRRNAETLVTKAKEKNLDGCALTYVELTLTCVRCHKHVREVRQVRLD